MEAHLGHLRRFVILNALHTVGERLTGVSVHNGEAIFPIDCASNAAPRKGM